MIGLAIDTTSESCSVALRAGEEVRYRESLAPRRHGELLPGWIGELLQEARLDRSRLEAVWVTSGPGSFTSIRLGFSVATALAFALDIPVVTVSSLLALAARCPSDRPVLAVLDARLGEVYAGGFSCRNGHWQALGDERLTQPQQLAGPDGLISPGIRVIGNGLLAADACLLKQCRELDIPCLPEAWPRARDLFDLADISSGVAAEAAELTYLRRQVTGFPPKIV